MIYIYIHIYSTYNYNHIFTRKFTVTWGTHKDKVDHTRAR